MKVVLGIVTILAIAAVLGFALVPGLWQHGKQVRNDVAEVVDKAGSDGHTEGMVESGFSASEKRLRDQYINLYKAQLEIAKIEVDTKSKQENLATQEQVLKKLQSLLEQNQPGAMITIGGTPRSWDQVNQDALQGLNECKIMRQAIQANEMAAAKLRKAHSDGIEVIRKAREGLRLKKMDFEADKAELAALRAQEQVADLAAQISPSADTQTELARVKKVFDDRLNDLRAKAGYDKDPALGSVVNKYAAGLGLGQQNAALGIKDYFQEKAKSAADTKRADVTKMPDSASTRTK